MKTVLSLFCNLLLCFLSLAGDDPVNGNKNYKHTANHHITGEYIQSKEQTITVVVIENAGNYKSNFHKQKTIAVKPSQLGSTFTIPATPRNYKHQF